MSRMPPFARQNEEPRGPRWSADSPTEVSRTGGPKALLEQRYAPQDSRVIDVEPIGGARTEPSRAMARKYRTSSQSVIGGNTLMVVVRSIQRIRTTSCGSPIQMLFDADH
jgi:hypothetical protein